METIERRYFERFKAKFPVRIQGSSHPFGETWLLRDASAEGARIFSVTPLSLDQALTIQVQLPYCKYALTLPSRVVWTKRVEPHIWDIGLKFRKTRLMSLAHLFKSAQYLYESNR